MPEIISGNQLPITKQEVDYVLMSPGPDDIMARDDRIEEHTWFITMDILRVSFFNLYYYTSEC